MYKFKVVFIVWHMIANEHTNGKVTKTTEFPVTYIEETFNSNKADRLKRRVERRALKDKRGLRFELVSKDSTYVPISSL